MKFSAKYIGVPFLLGFAVLPSCSATGIENSPTPVVEVNDELRRAKACASSNDCASGKYCTTEDGVCKPPPACRPGQVCAALCYGTCAPLKAAGSCSADADCRTFSDYCTGCDCRALSVKDPDPSCSGPGVRCFADPCMNQAAHCNEGKCALRSQGAEPGLCETGACGPQLGLPNVLCSDGVTVAGPTNRCLRGETGACGWEVIDCPPQK